MEGDKGPSQSRLNRFQFKELSQDELTFCLAIGNATLPVASRRFDLASFCISISSQQLPVLEFTGLRCPCSLAPLFRISNASTSRDNCKPTSLVEAEHLQFSSFPIRYSFPKEHGSRVKLAATIFLSGFHTFRRVA